MGRMSRVHMHGGVYLQDKAYSWDKNLKWYACQWDIAILYHYPAKIYLLEIAAYPLDKSQQDGGSY